MFKKILVASHSEIALRVIRAAHERGVRAVAVYSEADRLAPPHGSTSTGGGRAWKSRAGWRRG